MHTAAGASLPEVTDTLLDEVVRRMRLAGNPLKGEARSRASQCSKQLLSMV